MPWSTKRSRNSGPSRHILRLILLVIFGWILLYNLRYTNGPDAKSLRQLLRAEYDSKHPSPDSELDSSSSSSPPPPPPPPASQPQAGVVVGGPQIGGARFDIYAPDQRQENARPPLSPPPQSHNQPPSPWSSPDHPLSSSPSWLKTHYTSPASPGSPAVEHLILTHPPALTRITTRSTTNEDTTNEDTTSDDTASDDSTNAGSSGGASLLILVMTRDAHSWGRHEGILRTFRDFLGMLASSRGLDLGDCALGVLTSERGEFPWYEVVLDEGLGEENRAVEGDVEGNGDGNGDGEDEDGGHGVIFGGGVHLIYHPGYIGGAGAQGGGKGAGEVAGGVTTPGAWGRMLRHEDDIQHARRAEMARLRNYLMVSALGTVGKVAREVVWFDADIYELSDGLLGDMRRGIREEGDGEVGVVTSVSYLQGMDYDFNAWRGRRTRPSAEQWEAMRSGDVKGDGEGMGSWIAHLEEGVTLGDLVKLAEDDRVQLEEVSEWVWASMKKEALENERRDADIVGEERRKREDEAEEEVERWVKDVGEEMGRKLVEVEGGGGKVVGNLVTEGDGGEGKRLVKREESVFDPSKAEFEDGDDGDEAASSRAEEQVGDSSKEGEPKDNAQLPNEEKASSSATDAFDLPDFFRLDAVGATVLMLRADLVKQGLLFATSYLVGTDWESEGWDGIESEGLCITARTLGSGCWGIKKGFSRHVAG